MSAKELVAEIAEEEEEEKREGGGAGWDVLSDGYLMVGLTICPHCTRYTS